MDRRPSSAGHAPGARVTLTLQGPIGELAAALRTLANALERVQASSAVTYTATVEAERPGPAPGGMTPAMADRFVSQLSSAAVDVLALLCDNAPQVTYEDLQAHAQARLGISRAQIGGVLTSLAAGRPADGAQPMRSPVVRSDVCRGWCEAGNCLGRRCVAYFDPYGAGSSAARGARQQVSGLGQAEETTCLL